MDQVVKTVGDWVAAMVLVASVVAMAFAAYWREPFFPGEAEVVLICGLLLAVDFVRRCWNEPSSARRDAWSVAAWVGLTGCVAAFAVDGGLSDNFWWASACFGAPAFVMGVSMARRAYRSLGSTEFSPPVGGS